MSDAKFVSKKEVTNKLLLLSDPPGVVRTIAGRPSQAASRTRKFYTMEERKLVDGDYEAARFNYPSGLVFDGSENVLYVSDGKNNCIRKIDLKNRKVSSLPGEFRAPAGLALDTLPKDNNRKVLYVAESGAHCIRELDLATGKSIVLAGGEEGHLDGAFSEARFLCPQGLAVDAKHNLLVADTHNNVIRFLDMDSQEVKTIAGNPTKLGKEDGDALAQALFYAPTGIAVDSNDTIYVSDFYCSRIRCVRFVAGTDQREVASISGTGVALHADGKDGSIVYPCGLCLDDKKKVLYFTDLGSHTVRKIELANPTYITSTSGIGVSGFVDGTGLDAAFNSPMELCIGPNGDVFVADTGNCAIRQISFA